MKTPKQLLTEHPHSVGETYSEHLRSAWSFAGSMMLGAICCWLHGLMPWLWVSSGSQRVESLHRRMNVCV